MPLNGPRQKFAEGIAMGLSATDAYMAAYPAATPANAAKNTSRLTKNDEIMREVERIRAAAALLPGSAFLTIQEKRNFLARVVRSKPSDAGPNNPDSIVAMSKAGPYYTFPDKLRALAEDNDLAGDGAEASLAITITRAWK